MPGIVILLLVISGVWALRQAGRMPPDSQRRFTRQAIGLGLFLAGGIFMLKGVWFLGLPLFGLGAGYFGWQQLPFQKRSAPPQTNIKMERAEAYEVLGLKPSASVEEIRTAHKKLLRAIHPDTGGSTYLAAKINAARDFLLKG